MTVITGRRFAAVLTAGWTNAKGVAAATSKHVQNCRLAQMAHEIMNLEQWERRHLDDCAECQEMHYIYLTQPKG